MKETFPVSYVFPTETRPTNVQNIMIVSSNNPYIFDRMEFLDRAKNSPSDYLVNELSKQEHFYQGVIDTSDVPFLTDQYNPSEVLINPITGRIYDEKSQIKQIEKNNTMEDSTNLTLGITLSSIAGIWLIYFKNKIWLNKIPN